MSTFLLIPIGIAAGIYIIRKLREYQFGWVRTKYSLKGKLFIITGANTGLGYETTKALVKRQATVIMACRSLEKANEAKENIRKLTNEGEMIVLQLDLASLDSVRQFASKINSDYPNFDCLVNNAGLSVKTNQTTKDNYELHFGTNHLGHFLLTNLLKDRIKENESRIVIVSSKMHERGEIDFDNLGKCLPQPPSIRRNKYYADSKLANFYFARSLYKSGFDCHVLCPGLCNTDFFRDYEPKWYHWVMFSPVVWLFLRSCEQGAQNIIHCCTDNVNTNQKNPSTGYFVTSLKQKKSKIKFTDEISEKLWNESEKMVGLA